MARQLLNYHAALARKLEPEKRIFEGLGIRDSMMANNLEYIVSRERAGEKCWFLPTITISSEEKHSGNLELTCWHGGRWDLTSMRYSVHAMQLSALQSASRMQMASGNLSQVLLKRTLLPRQDQYGLFQLTMAGGFQSWQQQIFLPARAAWTLPILH